MPPTRARKYFIFDTNAGDTLPARGYGSNDAGFRWPLMRIDGILLEYARPDRPVTKKPEYFELISR